MRTPKPNNYRNWVELWQLTKSKMFGKKIHNKMDKILWITIQGLPKLLMFLCISQNKIKMLAIKI